ncbi:hypothetical protein PanWU01x14_124770 [Parasponia andersonii]|uniref:Transmembrane protein n=1 Tax=Parasponia andersonii TaxID=3476 RepID=A0A2P5CTM6_PARAD|nr:hypothetical protein PanWU01x14_124770 [Parasponia andersonii]
MAEPSLAPLIQSSNHPVHQTLASAANLANLLPTGTVLAFQIFSPSFSNSGLCHLSNKYLTASLIVVCAVFCFLSSFTDSFMGEDGKLRYGIATFRGLYVFNCEDSGEKDLEKFKLSFIDLVHGFMSLLLFLVFALSDSNVKSCYLSEVGSDWNALLTNLPLGAGALSSFLFTIFPTTRRGIGYADITPRA